jgi:hypothetical protein
MYSPELLLRPTGDHDARRVPPAHTAPSEGRIPTIDLMLVSLSVFLLLAVFTIGIRI